MNRLEAKVNARNKVNAVANALQLLLIEAFRPFVGQPIIKVDGTLLKKVKDALPELPEGAYHDRSNWSLRFGLSCSQNYPCGGYESAMTESESVYIGDMQGPILTRLYEPTSRRTDYTAEAVLVKRETLRKAKEAVSAAESDLIPFGEYDR